MKAGAVFWWKVKGGKVLFGVKGKRQRLIVALNNRDGLRLVAKSLRIKQELLDKTLEK